MTSFFRMTRRCAVLAASLVLSLAPLSAHALDSNSTTTDLSVNVPTQTR